MTPLLISLIVFVGVAAAVGGVALMFREKPTSRVEDRLDMLTGIGALAHSKDAAKKATVLSQPLDAAPGFLEDLAKRIGNFDRLFEQADTKLTFPKFALASAILGVGGAIVPFVLHLHTAVIPCMALGMAVLPTVWLLLRRRRRLRQFAAQLPDALDMLSRALRSGQSLGAGFSMVASEVALPLGKEFGFVFEEQNLGISLEESLESLTERVPNIDLRFFATAVILQRQTGGDLAEILDKIAHLIRERYQILGQVQALTGEGRLSGVVLLALPVVLFFVLYYMNPTYIMVLFTDPLGKKMLAGAVVLQFLGAVAIKKIITIKV
jgi:tight adherence protein B